MARLHQITERLSRRGTFLVLYGLIAIAVGIMNMIYLAMGPNPMQWVLWEVLARSPGESVLQSLLRGITSDFPFPIFQLCLVAPFILIALAFLRGRRLGMPFMVAFPIVGLVFALFGALPFLDWGSATAVAGPSVIAWLFDGWCLYLGAQPEPVDEVA